MGFFINVCKNILKGAGFKPNQIVINQLEKDPKWK